ncbi:MAG: hybrid sensor histidine kinase/response regulator [Cyclobacteriaceae bacterium]
MDNPHRRILIVDDQIENLQAIYQMLEKSAISEEISLASSASQAYQVIESELPDLIITDWEMPDINGIEFITTLKVNPDTRDIPIIMCTGIMTSAKNLETSLDAGAADYIRKPVDEVELIARVKANLHLSQQYRKIKLLNESKDTLFSIISHDLRGSIGIIQGFTDIIKMDHENFSQEQILEFIDIIGKQSRSIFAILENLLLWATHQKENVSIDRQKLPLHKAIAENIDLLEDAASKKQIRIVNTIPEHIHASFDMNMISTIFRNLIANAIKFTHENGLITLKAETTRDAIICSIEDTGVGISPERIEKVFQKNSFETTSGTQHESGSGLGLKLCQEFIEKHQGKIWVESEVDKGSCFKFSLPIL